MARFQLTKDEKAIVDSIVEKFHRRREEYPERMPLLTKSGLSRLIDSDELMVLERFLAIDPEAHGIKTPFLGIEDPPTDCVPIRDQRYVSRFDDEEKTIRVQFLPRRPYEALRRMNEAMRRDVGRGILVFSGYRSPWHQLLVLAATYQKRHYRLSRALRYVTVPGYSQHSDPKHTAVDIIMEDGTYTAKHFPATEEYAWLKEHAEEFGFAESYPKDNKLGVAYEPWHWRYMG